VQRPGEVQHLCGVAEPQPVEDQPRDPDAPARHLPDGRRPRVAHEVEVELVGDRLVPPGEEVERHPVRRDVGLDPPLVSLAVGLVARRLLLARASHAVGQAGSRDRRREVVGPRGALVGGLSSVSGHHQSFGRTSISTSPNRANSPRSVSPPRSYAAARR
jgi:hypothetical protein